MPDSLTGLSPAAEIRDIESKLHSPEFYTGPETITPLDENLIRRWLVLKGVSQAKASHASKYVLYRAYNVGEYYVRKMVEDDGNSRRRGGFKGIDFEDQAKTRFAPEISKLLEQSLDGEMPMVPMAPDPDGDEIETGARDKNGRGMPPLTPAPTPTGGAPGITVETLAPILAQVAQSTIAPKLDAAKQAMLTDLQLHRRALEGHVNGRWTEALKLFEGKTAGLIDAAKAQVSEIALKMLPRKVEISFNGVTLETLDEEIRHEAFERILKRLMIGRHVCIVGPAGTGKTHMAKQLARALGRPLTLLGQALTKYEFSGHIGPTGEYVKTLLRTAVEEGHLLFIDEIDMSSAAAIGFLNSLTANRFVAFPDRMVDAHPNFVLCAAANTYGNGATQEYIGRNPLDAASRDRFAYITIDYDENLERTIYGTGPWVTYVHRVRRAVRELQLLHVVSTRAIEKILEGVKLGEPTDENLAASLWIDLDRDTISRITQIAGTPPTKLHGLEIELDDNEDEIPAGLGQFKTFVLDNSIVSAIRELRFSYPDLGLKEAKDLTENYRDGHITLNDLIREAETLARRVS